MTNPTPRTRRQLREALSSATAQLRVAEHRADGAEKALDRHGFKQTQRARVGIEVGWLAPEDSWTRKPDAPLLFTADEHEKIVERRVAEAVNGARRGTLAAVVRALNISGYRGNLINIQDDSKNRIDTDRFWADIQTALEVREEKRAAEERTATEKKVADLLRRDSANFFIVPNIDTTAPRVRDLAGSTCFGTASPADPLRAPESADESTVTPAAARAMIADYLAQGCIKAEDLQDIATVAESTPRTVSTKKPAKKKPEGKK